MQNHLANQKEKEKERKTEVTLSWESLKTICIESNELYVNVMKHHFMIGFDDLSYDFKLDFIIKPQNDLSDQCLQEKKEKNRRQKLIKL